MADNQNILNTLQAQMDTFSEQAQSYQSEAVKVSQKMTEDSLKYYQEWQNFFTQAWEESEKMAKKQQEFAYETIEQVQIYVEASSQRFQDFWTEATQVEVATPVKKPSPAPAKTAPKTVKKAKSTPSKTKTTAKASPKTTSKAAGKDTPAV